jgi:alpha-glucosidase (family GH31 glycosyl hydrolase)
MAVQTALSPQEVLEVAREYRRRHLPLSVMVIDFFHWPNQGTWCFDPWTGRIRRRWWTS